MRGDVWSRRKLRISGAVDAVQYDLSVFGVAKGAAVYAQSDG